MVECEAQWGAEDYFIIVKACIMPSRGKKCHSHLGLGRGIKEVLWLSLISTAKVSESVQRYVPNLGELQLHVMVSCDSMGTLGALFHTDLLGPLLLCSGKQRTTESTQ